MPPPPRETRQCQLLLAAAYVINVIGVATTLYASLCTSVAAFFYWLAFCFIYTERNFHSNFTFLEPTCR